MTQEWIPVTEKLPEANGYYLVSTKIKYTTSALDLVNNKVVFCSREVTIAEYVDKEWYTDYCDVDERVKISGSVTAWMPVPRPYYDGDD